MHRCDSQKPGKGPDSNWVCAHVTPEARVRLNLHLGHTRLEKSGLLAVSQ